MARSRVAPKRQLSIPRLELCAALTGAQVSKLLKTEISIPISSVTLWTDSTTVLNWLHSNSCRFKVFVGTRVAEIQELTEHDNWRYVDSVNNPADYITRGKTLIEIAKPGYWRFGPPFLLQHQRDWPEMTCTNVAEDIAELKPPKPCTVLLLLVPAIPDISQFRTYGELLEATVRLVKGAEQDHQPCASDYQKAELLLVRRAQIDSFPDEFNQLQEGKPVSSSSRLITLSPEFDHSSEIIRVGGRLRRAELLECDAMHPIILDPTHPVTKLLIQRYDEQLSHPGPERLFAEIRRTYWILRGREAIRKHQHVCRECQRWRAKPQMPKMADLPLARLRLFKPAFYSTGVDCFGPFIVKVGRRNEKRWGVVFKCLTTRCVYLDIFNSMDADSFLMTLRRFIPRRGKPYELLCDQGTNFRGSNRELCEAFASLTNDLKLLLAKQKIRFQFNPPGAPHFGGAWEREIRSIKTALNITLGSQTVTEEVLRTILVEVEGILNAKPLGLSILNQIS
ncbi:uncharacterized protein LOC120528591 [Polypterus senegalus]|uniref:uncharacterized protein LOC120528591 n=1 Tax=Polypterus senegalus TaxID=55291 RepID=UPI0019631733|nr:uncharacterized protein LOC120528591 [Polypterus senegalus]